MPQNNDDLLGLLGLGPSAVIPAAAGLTADKYAETAQAAIARGGGGGVAETLRSMFPMASGAWGTVKQAATRRGLPPESLPVLQAAMKQPERPSRATVNVPLPAAPLSVALAEEFPSRPLANDVETAELLQSLRASPSGSPGLPWAGPGVARADLPPGYAGWAPGLPQRGPDWHLARQQAPMPARRSQEEQAIAYEALLQDLAPLYAQAQTQELEAETAIQSAAENELLLQRLEGLR